MAWIESHQTLGNHPKTKKMARLCGISLPAAVGHLQFLWWWAMDYAQDGDLSRFDIFDISDAAMWEGDATVFISSIKESGFLDDNMHIHDWNDYAGKLIERREKNAFRMKSARSRNVQDMCSARAQNVQDTCGATQPNPTQPNPTVPNHTPLPPYGGEAPAAREGGDKKDQFEVFWDAYPKKQSKVIARKEWGKLNPSPGLLKTILTSISFSKKSDQWMRDGGRYIPDPANWIIKRRWEDDPPEFKNPNLLACERTYTHGQLRSRFTNLDELDDTS